MGFNPTFYAGRPKLSEVTIDSDLDMGGRTIRAGRIDSPYMPETWPTETLDWGDIAPTETVHLDDFGLPSTPANIPVMTVAAASELVFRVAITGSSAAKAGLKLRCNGVDLAATSEDIASGSSYDFPAFIYKSGDSISLYGRSVGGSKMVVSSVNTGRVVTAKTFNLTGKWLALGIDMKGLAATVKIQGVEMPYSDYAKYFPLAPSELKIPGEWGLSQIRPDVKGYL